MATLNHAVQTLVDNLHEKMAGDEPFTGDEQTLVATAIDKLSASGDWPQALATVAQTHLGDAELSLNQTQTSATEALTDAGADIASAKAVMAAQNADLGVIATLGNNVKNTVTDFVATHQAKINRQLANMPRPVFGLVPLETATTSYNSIRSEGVFAVYDATGDSYLVRPAVDSVGEQSFPSPICERTRMEHVTLFADGSGISTMASHYSTFEAHYPTPETYIYHYGTSAILPLASKDDDNDIAWEVVYSLQNAASDEVADYGGVFCRSAGNTTITKPTLNLDAVDQWGFSTKTTHAWNQTGVLYDNNKHCLVMVDYHTSLLIEKYRDGNVYTTTRVMDASQWQSYVDGGDFTVVRFISNEMQVPYGIKRVDGALTNMTNSSAYDMYGYFGLVGGVERMGNNFYCAHYQFTTAKRLEPLNYFYSSSATMHTEKGANGVNSARGDLTVTIEDMRGQTLGVYHYQSKADAVGKHAGCIGGALMCMNPYSHVGILNDHATWTDAVTGYYGLSRTCKAY